MTPTHPAPAAGVEDETREALQDAIFNVNPKAA